MPDNQSKISQFWQELRRRKVIRVISIYAAAAFIILELTDIVAPSLGLPVWTLNFIIILLCVGFVIALILSWIFDIHPGGGLVKTEPVDKEKSGGNPSESRGWKIATFLSVVVILALLALNLFSKRGNAKMEIVLEKSIAVLPFQNLSEEAGNEQVLVSPVSE